MSTSADRFASRRLDPDKRGCEGTVPADGEVIHARYVWLDVVTRRERSVF